METSLLFPVVHTDSPHDQTEHVETVKALSAQPQEGVKKPSPCHSAAAPPQGCQPQPGFTSPGERQECGSLTFLGICLSVLPVI